MGEDPNDDALSRRPSGRRPGAHDTRNDILRAARIQFGALGFGATSLRSVATEAGVDTALIHHYFKSKEGLFVAAIQDVMAGGSLMAGLEGDPHTVAAALVDRYLNLWESAATQPALMAVLRSAFENDHAKSVLVGAMLPADPGRAAGAPADSDDVAASLIGSHLLGTAAIRYLIELEPLASLDRAELATLLTRTVEMYLTADPG